MNTAEETKKNAAFVRDLIAMIEIKFPADDYERGLRDGMFRKAFSLAPEMDEMHIRRINEALCGMEFPSEAALGLRRQTLTLLAQAHNLKEFRNVKMPFIRPAARPEGKAVAK